MIETKPTIKPDVIRLGVLFTIGFTVIIALITQPELLGNVETTNVVLTAIQLLLVVVSIALLVRIFIRLRTTYIITSNSIRKEFELLFRRKTREVPIPLVRSVEFSQSRIEHFLGIGSVTVNNGLGELSLTSLRNPMQVNDMIQNSVRSISEQNPEL